MDAVGVMLYLDAVLTCWGTLLCEFDGLLFIVLLISC